MNKMRLFFKRLQNICNIDILVYLKLNYFSNKIVKMGKGRIIPYKGAIIEMAPGSVIYIGDNDVLIGTNKLKHSKAETYIRLRENSLWDAQYGCAVSFGSTIEVLKNARLETGYFTMNSFSTIVSSRSITLGNDVMIARDVIIYDSDFHQIKVKKRSLEKSLPVTIGNHVWLGSRSIILKGVAIGRNSIVAAGAIITEDVNEGMMVAGRQKLKILNEDVGWDR